MPLCGLMGDCSSEMSNIRQHHFCLHSEMSGSVIKSFRATSIINDSLKIIPEPHAPLIDDTDFSPDLTV